MEQLPAPPATNNMLTVTHTDGSGFNTRSCTKQDSTVIHPVAPPDITPDISPDTSPTPKSLTADRLEALIQMQKADPFCKCISKCLLNGKAPKHETHIFTHVKGLLYKHVLDSGLGSLLLSSLNPGNTQSWWKPMTN